MPRATRRGGGSGRGGDPISTSGGGGGGGGGSDDGVASGGTNDLAGRIAGDPIPVTGGSVDPSTGRTVSDEAIEARAQAADIDGRTAVSSERRVVDTTPTAATLQADIERAANAPRVVDTTPTAATLQADIERAATTAGSRPSDSGGGRPDVTAASADVALAQRAQQAARPDTDIGQRLSEFAASVDPGPVSASETVQPARGAQALTQRQGSAEVRQEAVDAAQGAVFGLQDTLERGGEGLTEGVVEPFAARVGAGVDALTLTEDLGETDAQTDIGRSVESAVAGAGETIAQAPAGALGAGITAAEAGQFTAEAIGEQGVVEGGQTAAAAGTAVAARTGGALAEAAADDPANLFGELAGGAAVGTAVSPFRVSRVDVPTTRGQSVELSVETQRTIEGVADDTPTVSRTVTESTGETRVRGLRVETPPVARPFVGDRNIQGTTIAGTTGARPQLGTPEVDLERVDLREMGAGTAQTGPVFEPQGPFETDVFTSSAPSAGPEAVERVGAAQGLLAAGESVTGRARAGDVQPVTEAIESAEEIGDDVPAEEVADVLAETDATLFGSGAVRAQAPDFRDPGDIDFVTPRPEAAERRLSETLEGTSTGLEAFDIKAPEDFQGLGEGEVFGFGRRSQAPVESPEGVRVNPIGEELQRNVGASAFFRGPEVGGEGVDVGPRPVRGPGTPTRQKDVEDAAAIAEEVGVDERATQQFRAAFGLAEGEGVPTPRPRGTDVAAPAGQAGLFGLAGGVRDDVRRLAADDRAQVTLAGRGGRAGDLEPDARRVETRADADTTATARRVADERERTPSPTPESPGTRGTPAGSPTGGVFGPEEPGSPSPTPGGRADVSASTAGVPEPSPTPTSPAPESPAPAPSPDPFGPVPSVSVGPVGDGGPSDVPSPGPEGSPQPDPSPTPGPSPGPFPSPGPVPSPPPEPVPGPSPGPAPSPVPGVPGTPAPQPRLGSGGDRGRDDRETTFTDAETRATPLFANPIADVLPTQIERQTPAPPGQGGPVGPLFDEVSGDAGFGDNQTGPFGDLP